MRYPEFLKEGGRIGFIAPSFGAYTEPYHSLFDNALKKFGELGYNTVLGPNCYEGRGIGKSNTAKKCGEEINDFFTSKECDVIISCGGGETMCEDLNFVDFEAISRADPKWYLGYSDNTNLTLTLPTLADTAAIYGPCASSFGMEPWHESISDALDILTGKKLENHNYDKWEREDIKGENPYEPYNVTEDFAMKIYEGSDMHLTENAYFEGRLIGGCLDVLSILCGTKFDKVESFCEKYKEDGIIFFLEACELTPMSVRRSLWQLENAGWFKNVKGFLIGRPMMYDADGMGFDRYTAVTGILDKYKVPVLMDLDIGHLPPQMPIISGAYASVLAKDGKINIRYELK